MKSAIIFIVGAGIALGACSSNTTWNHPETGVATLNRDYASCSFVSQNIVSNTLTANAATSSLASAGPDAPVGMKPVAIPNENDLTSECMWGKGYYGGVDHRPQANRVATTAFPDKNLSARSW